MRTALQLLTLLTDRFPPTAPAKHALSVADGKLTVTLSLGREWASFHLDEEDLDRPAEDIVIDVVAMLKGDSSP